MVSKLSANRALDKGVEYENDSDTFINEIIDITANELLSIVEEATTTVEAIAEIERRRSSLVQKALNVVQERNQQ